MERVEERKRKTERTSPKRDFFFHTAQYRKLNFLPRSRRLRNLLEHVLDELRCKVEKSGLAKISDLSLEYFLGESNVQLDLRITGAMSALTRNMGITREIVRKKVLGCTLDMQS